MKINFRKIASVLTSTVMLGSTVALAAAANYPAPFVKGGNADVAVVWGSTAASTDLVAVTDITSDLQAELAAQTASSGSSSSGTTVSGGDFVKLARSSDNVNLGDSLATVFGSRITKDNLPVLLADGTYLNAANNEYNYEQTISLGTLTLAHFADSDYKDKEPTIGFNIADNTKVLLYTMDFTQDPESSVTSGSLVDFETTTLNILGKSYYVLDAQNGSTSGAAGTAYGKFTLLDTANTATVAEGETQKVTVGSTQHEVSIDSLSGSASAPRVKLNVDGEVTNTLSEGQTFRLTDGSYVGIKDISMRDVAGSIGKVEFSLGSGKLEVENGQDIKLNDDSINGLTGNFTRASAASATEKLDKMTLQWTTDARVFMTPDQKLDMPGFGALEFSMGPFFTPDKEVTKVGNDGDDAIQLEAPIKDGTAKFDILYGNSSGLWEGIGKASDELLATSASTLLLYNASSGADRLFVASWNSSSESESYLLSATVSESDSKNRTTVKNEVTGEDVCSDKATSDICNIGSVSLTINSVYKQGSGRWVNFTAGSGVSFNTLYTKDGMKIALPVSSNAVRFDGSINFSAEGAIAGHDNETFLLFFTEENKDNNVALGTKFNMTLAMNGGTTTSPNAQVSDINTGQSEYETADSSDTYVSYVRSDLASLVTIDKGGDQDVAQVEYHGGQSYADVFLAAVGTTVSSDGTTSSGGVVKKLGSVAVSDAEVASVASNNLIVVGGSCVNSVAAQLLGGALCGADFEQATGAGSGSFVIETFSRSSGKVATLVAGYNAADTTNAAKYLTTQAVDTTVGKKYVGSSATSAELVTTSG